jgi:Icc-related predicted phosphoesterase
VRCFFTSDLHGRLGRYRALLARIAEERPDAVLLGGDLLPHAMQTQSTPTGGIDFVNDFLAVELLRLAGELGDAYPTVLVILGNDDPRFQEASVLRTAALGVWTYVHDRRVTIGDVNVYGYSFVPPTPFLNKDWERYDVSRYVDPGSVSPEEGFRSVPMPEQEQRFATIERDLERLAGSDDLSRALFLFHSPPYQTNLDRAALDGKFVDHVPLDPHVGSIAIRRFIERRQPLATLHGHIHEAPRLTGTWCDRIGRTRIFSGAHDGRELPLVRFDTDDLDSATRDLVPTA